MEVFHDCGPLLIKYSPLHGETNVESHFIRISIIKSGHQFQTSEYKPSIMDAPHHYECLPVKLVVHYEMDGKICPGSSSRYSPAKNTVTRPYVPLDSNESITKTEPTNRERREGLHD